MQLRVMRTAYLGVYGPDLGRHMVLASDTVGFLLTVSVLFNMLSL